MCTVFGFIRKNPTEENLGLFLESTHQQSLERGKELSIAVKAGANYFDSCCVGSDIKRSKMILSHSGNYNCIMCHMRTPTNQSKDKYPIIMKPYMFAMNGIVSQTEYDLLITKYGKLKKYKVDSAYLLKHLIENKFNWEIIDSLDYVFAGGLLNTSKNTLTLFNKDYPLFIKDTHELLKFSSFDYKDPKFKPLGNSVVEINLDNGKRTHIYKFKNNVYNI